MNEKIGGAEGTKLDDDFVEMEKVSSSIDPISAPDASFYLCKQ
jgi:hypothetical protein